jgi:hypothetical protein
MSSYMQLIVNEIYLRTKGQIKIVFEPGVKEFEYGNPRLSVQPVTTRNAAALGFVRTEGQKKVSELLSANADPDIRADLDETDRVRSLGKNYKCSLLTSGFHRTLIKSAIS